MTTTAASPANASQLSAAALAQITIFAAIDPELLAMLNEHFRQQRFADGSAIFLQESAPDNIYIVLAGGIKLDRDIGGQRVQIGHIASGGCFGQVAAIGIQPRMCSASCVGDTELLIIPSSSLDLLHRQNCEAFAILMTNIAREICRRMVQVSAQLCELLANAQH